MCIRDRSFNCLIHPEDSLGGCGCKPRLDGCPEILISLVPDLKFLVNLEQPADVRIDLFRLDVYKRQGLNGIIPYRQKNNFPSVQFLLIYILMMMQGQLIQTQKNENKVSCTAVSYTHLDVYKRQPLRLDDAFLNR